MPPQEEEVIQTAKSILSSLKCVNWDSVRVATSTDTNLNKLLHFVENGIPEERSEMDESIRVYHQYREALSAVDGVILYKDRIVVPSSLRNEVLNSLHSAHQGISSMISRAEVSVFWPGITKDITSQGRIQEFLKGGAKKLNFNFFGYCLILNFPPPPFFSS